MGGGPKEVGPTEEETVLAEIAGERWSQYETHGIPLENHAIERTTGYRLNEETNEYEVSPNGRLNADGTTRTDVSTAVTATEDAFGDAMMQVDPNRGSVIDQLGADSVESGAQSQIDMAMGQQTNTMKGIVNAASMGQGREAEALQSQAELAGQAVNQATADAQRSFDNQSATQYAVGQVVGAVGTAAGRRYSSSLDKATASRSGPVTRRKAGDHHGV